MLWKLSFARLSVLSSLILGILSICISSPARAQDGVAGAAPVFSGPRKQLPAAPAKTDSTKEGIVVQSNLVTTPVTVVDPSGEFVYDLQENDFRVLDNGAPQRLEGFEVEERTLAAVIVMQTNDTVRPVLEPVRPLAPMFSSLMLGAQGQAAVIFFDDRIRVAQDFSRDTDRLESTLRGIDASGSKARLNDALMRAVQLLEQRPKHERRIIIAFSDGFDQGSETVKEEVVREAANAEVTIYGLGFSPAQEILAKKPEPPPQSPLDANVTRPLPPGRVPTPSESANVYGTPIPIVPILVATGEVIQSAIASSLLEYYAGYTGGVFYSHWSKKSLEDQLSRISSEIHSQYELAYVPDTLAQPGFHRIEVRVGRPGVKVRTRAGYFYSAKNP
jgi:VWFA-related protein